MNKEYINLARVEYKEKRKVFCPYIGAEVESTSSGFKHLLWKSNQVPRSSIVVKERLESLKYASEILLKSGTLQEYEKVKDREFYCFIAIYDENKYKVVVAKYNKDKYKFVSIIPKWKTGKRDK